MSLLQTIFGFDGRMSRQAYFWYGFGTLIVGTVLVGLGGSAAASVAGRPAGLTVAAVVGLAVVWIAVAVTVKRLHDIGWSGIHAAWIIPLVAADWVLPFVRGLAPSAKLMAMGLLGLILLAVLVLLLFRRSAHGANQYGPPPDAAAAPAAP